MLTIKVLGDEFYDEEKEEFFTKGDVVLELEHSLVALSKWESEYEKPFLGKNDKTQEEIVGYIRAMTLTPNVSPEVYGRLSNANFMAVNDYIEKKMTATWFSDTQKSSSNREVITSELIYYWMLTLNIPVSCENWNLSRLFTLIRICDVKSSKPKKMSRSEIAARNRELNAQRKAQLQTKG